MTFYELSVNVYIYETRIETSFLKVYIKMRIRVSIM